MVQTIAVLDFGSQYTQVIARRIRECEVYSKIYHYTTTAEELKRDGVAGIILSGGPSSVFDKAAPIPDKALFDLGVPVLGICYGIQLMGKLLGGKVAKSKEREFGLGTLQIQKPGRLFYRLPKKLKVWNSHGDKITELPPGFDAIGTTDNSPYAVIEDRKRDFYGIQFHPEVFHTERGTDVIRNFLLRVCKVAQDWTTEDYIKQAVKKIRQTVGKSRVILGLSGGVDSSVAAALIHKAIKKQLTCVFVDNGLLRKGERESVEALYGKHFKIDLRVIDARQLFLRRLKGVEDPEKKRRIIGLTFIEVFEKSLKKIGHADFLAQGTLYPDVIESVAIGNNPASLIKSHHNVGGLPERMKLKLLEPLRELFKDEVRAVGAALGLPREVVWRQPFPGPGLGVRVLGDITKAKLDVLKEADAILMEEMKDSDWYWKVWQSFCVFLPVKSVGVIGDERNYAWVIAIRVVESIDAMTADWTKLPYDLLARISNRITNEVRDVSRVVLDISSKPPATIEWE
ncbi:glutamine-hydrolyzing GMP synthase [Synoicihabitans lomoniglobus]|uniref:GMP synthase [glutamine-hydrolyzing] n=1 Tax=Synoicihabitans lomoniglobus TaxID=2909285 RepID=A0AAF0CNK5_9BACT|nr:glutamine-hydrolyzing GMP synthase [Opitutaceae bacterium LMO-M01]WED65643.1 glutamine-hydrolyzing GMP synthase [Opitutaceae bacterium LMO-M01]